MVNDFKGAATALEGEVEFGAINAETHKDFVNKRFKLSSYPTCVRACAMQSSSSSSSSSLSSSSSSSLSSSSSSSHGDLD